LAVLELERAFGQFEHRAAERDRARGNHQHVALVAVQPRDVLGERGEPVLVHARSGGIHDQRGADLHHDAAKVGKAWDLKAWGLHGCQAASGDFAGWSGRAASITLMSVRSTSGTPAPVAAETTSGARPAARLRRATCALSASGVSASALLRA